MDLNFSKEDLEFRDEVRAFLENEYPKHIKEKMHNLKYTWSVHI